MKLEPLFNQIVNFTSTWELFQANKTIFLVFIHNIIHVYNIYLRNIYSMVDIIQALLTKIVPSELYFLESLVIKKHCQKYWRISTKSFPKYKEEIFRYF